MKASYLIIIAVLAASPATAQQNAATPVPLTQMEVREGIDAGLSCSFSTAAGTLLVVTTTEALGRPAGVVTHIKLTQERGLAIINNGGVFGNSVLRVIVDADDESVSDGKESARKTARLTFRKGGAEKTVDGEWSCGA